MNTTCAEDVAVGGRYVYVADGPGGLVTIDALSPSKLLLKNINRTTYGFRVYIKNGYLYLCDGPGGLKTYSLENPASPALTSSIDTGWASGLAFRDGYAFLADYYGGIKVFNLDEPSLPVLVSTRESIRARDIAVDGIDLVVSDSVFGLVNFRIDSATDLVWTFNGSEAYSNYEDIVLHNGYGLVSRNAGSAMINVFHMFDPDNIEEVATFVPVKFISGMTGDNDLLLVAAGTDGVLGFDMTNPEAIRLLWVIDTPGYARRAKKSGNFLYVADLAGLAIFDISGKEGT